jgi:hypothetical protein
MAIGLSVIPDYHTIEKNGNLMFVEKTLNLSGPKVTDEIRA